MELAERLVTDHTVLSVVVGSRAYGLRTESSDTDRRGVFVAPTPLFAEEASRLLRGRPASEATFIEAGRLAQQIAKPISDKRGPAQYRTHLVGVLTKRTLAIAVQRAKSQR